MVNKTIKSIQMFWSIAPHDLKQFVKRQVHQNGYGNDLSGEMLRQHIWECEKWIVSTECCRDLVKHYNSTKRLG